MANPLETGIIDAFQLPSGCWKQNFHLEQQMFLSTEPTSQPIKKPVSHLSNIMIFILWNDDNEQKAVIQELLVVCLNLP